MENTTLQRQQAGALNGAQITMINQRTPQELIKVRKGKNGKMFAYVPNAWVTRLLNEAFCHAWSFETVPILEMCNQNELVVKGRLTINTPAGAIIKEQYGSCQIEFSKDGKPGMTSGDALKGAGSDALRKCASLLGIALDLYGEEFPDATNTEAEQAERRDPATQPNADAQHIRVDQARNSLDQAIKELKQTRETIDGKTSAYIYFTRKLFEAGTDAEKIGKLGEEFYYFRKNGELKRAA